MHSQSLILCMIIDMAIVNFVSIKNEIMAKIRAVKSKIPFSIWGAVPPDPCLSFIEPPPPCIYPAYAPVLVQPKYSLVPFLPTNMHNWIVMRP